MRWLYQWLRDRYPNDHIIWFLIFATLIMLFMGLGMVYALGVRSNVLSQ